MGTALARAAQWTDDDSGTRTLESTPLNKSLLKQIIKFVEGFGTAHPEEAAFVFREPLEWNTQLDCSVFGKGYQIKKGNVQSEAKGEDGQPLLLLTASALRVRSFHQLSCLLKTTLEKKLKEAQACLEANRDPIVKILGPQYGTFEGKDVSTLHLPDEVKKGDDPKTEMNTKIFLLLHQLDLQLLDSSLKHISQGIELNPAAIDQEVNLLKRFSGKGEDTVLESLEYTSDYMFSNGCRAPPWRQVHGEMCYLVIKPHDTDPFYITCSTAGVFLNGGQQNGKDYIDYDRKSDVYKNIVTFLRERSPKFVENMAKQDFKVFEEPTCKDDQCMEVIHAKDNVCGKVKSSAERRSTDKKKFEPFKNWKNTGNSGSRRR